MAALIAVKAVSTVLRGRLTADGWSCPLLEA
jgi:hypothetical protein